MNKWYNVSVKLTKELPDGTIKRVTDKFLFNSFSFTDVEARVNKEIGEKTKGSYVIHSIRESGYEDIFDYKDSENWFKVKISAVTEDADSGEKGKLTATYLVTAKDIKQAPIRIEEKLKGSMISFKIVSVIEIDLEETFPYVEGVESENEAKIETIKFEEDGSR